MAADGGCERDVVHCINEGYIAWEAMKSVLNNGGLGLKAKKCLLYMKEQLCQRVVRSRGMGNEKCQEQDSECS